MNRCRLSYHTIEIGETQAAEDHYTDLGTVPELGMQLVWFHYVVGF